MAHANGIPTNDVWQIDASRQTTRMSANVSGFGNTMRITLNDNLIQRGSPEEIQAVMGHEMGHYVMNHIPKSHHVLPDPDCLSFAYLFWGLKWALGRWGERWQIQSVGDPAVVPLVMLLVAHPRLRAHAHQQHVHARAGERSRHVRPQRLPPARRLCAGRDPPRRVPQDAPRPRSRSSSSTIIPAATTASTPPWCGRARISISFSLHPNKARNREAKIGVMKFRVLLFHGNKPS